MMAALIVVVALVSAIIGGVVAALIVVDSLRRANTPQSGGYGNEQRGTRAPSTQPRAVA